MQAPHFLSSLVAFGAVLLHLPKRPAVTTQPKTPRPGAVNFEQLLQGHPKDLRGLTDISEMFFS